MYRETGAYSYEEVSRWGRRIDLSTLEQLFVPINIDNVHWIFIRVLFEDKTIELYDPQGRRDHTNRRYMEDMRQFLHRELHKVNQGQNGRTVMVELPEDQRPPYDVWKREWTYKDMSRQAPAQENTYDYGVFTIVSIYLLSHGLELASTTYNQQAIYLRKVQEVHTSFYRGTSGRQERDPAPQPSWAQRADGR